jgi:AAA domain
VLYLDFDSDDASVVTRLLDFGADPQLIDLHFDYRHPEIKPDAKAERQAWADMVSRPCALAVIDGVTDALGVFGYSTRDNDDVSRWIREVPKLIAARTGAAVVLIDHVTKDAGTRGRFAIGGQAKMAGLTGAAYTAEVTAPLGRGLRGEVVLGSARTALGPSGPIVGLSARKTAPRRRPGSSSTPPSTRRRSLSAHRAFEETKTSASRMLFARPI